MLQNRFHGLRTVSLKLGGNGVANTSWRAAGRTNSQCFRAASLDRGYLPRDENVLLTCAHICDVTTEEDGIAKRECYLYGWKR